jgi:hypothetical protein
MIRSKVLPDVVGPATTALAGVVHLSWRRHGGVSTSLSLAWNWLLSLGESLNLEQDWHGGGV